MWMLLACVGGPADPDPPPAFETADTGLPASPDTGPGDTSPPDTAAPPWQVTVACDLSTAHPLAAPSDGWTQEWLASIVIDDFAVPTEASAGCPRVELVDDGAIVTGDCTDTRDGTVYTGRKQYLREDDGSVTVRAEGYGWSGEVVTGEANLRAYGHTLVQTTSGWRRSTEDGRRSWCTSAANLLLDVDSDRWTYRLAYLYTEEGVGTATVLGSVTIDQATCSQDPELEVRLYGERELHLLGGQDCDGCLDWSAEGEAGRTCPNED